MIRYSPRLHLGRHVTAYRSGVRVGGGLTRWFVSWPRPKRRAARRK